MKILIISHEYPPVGGGGANACMNLAREYALNGNEIHIVTVWFEGQKESESIYNGKVNIHRLKSKRQYLDHCSFSEMIAYLVKALPFADKLEQEEHFDVCQIFFGIPSGPVGYYLKKKYKLPYVIRFGGGDIPGFQDRFAFIYKVISPAVKIIWKNADALVANSKGLKTLAGNFYHKKEIEIIPNGVDANAFQDFNFYTNRLNHQEIDKVKKNITDDKIIILLFVSRLIERKGLQDVLPQLRRVDLICQEHGKKIRLVVVGDGPYRENLERIVSENGIEDIVSFVGQKAKGELPRYYSEADIFIFPSKKEGMPNVVLEAMSYGLPIIMTPCQGSEELIDGNGIVADVGLVGDKILDLVFDDHTISTMRKRSMWLVRNKFSWSQSAKKYLDIFNSLVEQSDSWSGKKV